MKIFRTVTPKPCPCCESQAEAYQTDSRTVGHGESDDGVGIRCTNCLLNVELRHYAGYQVDERLIKAILIWDKRPNE